MTSNIFPKTYNSAHKRIDRRQELEVIIYSSQLRMGVRVGEALKEIRDFRLYRDEYSSFDTYCRERWGHNRSWADRLIKNINLISDFDEKVGEDLDPIGSRFPKNEAQSRALRGLSSEQQIQVRQKHYCSK